jgi:hypothetical protein
MNNQIRKYAKEFLKMERGEKIADPKEIISISRTVVFTRRSLKHFIESRTAQGISRSDIYFLLKKASEIIRNPQLSILNPNQSNYPGSFLFGSFYKEKKKAVIVMLDRKEGARNIITIYFAKRSAFFKSLSAQEKNE